MPTQLPLESTDLFGDLLFPHTSDILQSDATKPLESHNFSYSIQSVCICKRFSKVCLLITSKNFCRVLSLAMVHWPIASSTYQSSERPQCKFRLQVWFDFSKSNRWFNLLLESIVIKVILAQQMGENKFLSWVQEWSVHQWWNICIVTKEFP